MHFFVSNFFDVFPSLTSVEYKPKNQFIFANNALLVNNSL